MVYIFHFLFAKHADFVAFFSNYVPFWCAIYSLRNWYIAWNSSSPNPCAHCFRDYFGISVFSHKLLGCLVHAFWFAYTILWCLPNELVLSVLKSQPAQHVLKLKKFNQFLKVKHTLPTKIPWLCSLNEVTQFDYSNFFFELKFYTIEEISTLSYHPPTMDLP